MPGFEIFGQEEKESVNEVLETGILFRYGFDAVRKDIWKAKTFEKEFANYINTKHCLLVSSGTSALSIALAACGIGYGDEVIVPPFTFVATVESVLAAGAVPVFAEIDETLCLAPNHLEKFISDKTKAVIPVHMCGAMAQIDKIKEITDKHNLILIEDACQATGAKLYGKYAGTWGKAGCFSFDAVKTITCGEGGGVVTDDDNIYLKADAYHDHGHDHVGNDRGKENHEFPGLNSRISELNAAVGVAQLKKLDRILEIQRKNHKILAETIQRFPQIKLREVPEESGDSCTFISFILPTEDIARKISNELQGAGVDGTFYWYDNNWHYTRNWNHIKTMHTAMKMPQSQLENMPDYSHISLPQSDNIIGRTISMQIKLLWTEEQLSQRCEKMAEVYAGNFSI